MSKLNQHVKSDKVKWIITGIVLVLILALLGGVIAMLFMNRNSGEEEAAVKADQTLCLNLTSIDELVGYEFNEASDWTQIATEASSNGEYSAISLLAIDTFSPAFVLTDLGNFPLWNNDLFRRDSRLMDALSRHSHILDFDMLRLGKKMIERNAKSNAFEFGVLIMTEVGKERGNMLETSEMKKSDEEANQKNDRFNVWMKMIRHSATVDNFPFVRVMMDEQRAMSLGADARELAYIIEIEETGELRLAMPFFQLGEILHAVVGRRFAKWYEDHRYRRGDNTLVSHFLKWLAAAETRHYERIYNTFSYKRVSVKMQNGSLEGESKERKYYIMPKKIYSKRFSTDAYADFFYEKAIRSEVGIEDLEEYESERATLPELEAQHSYFIGNLMKNFELDDKPQDRAVSKQQSRVNGKNP